MIAMPNRLTVKIIFLLRTFKIKHLSRCKTLRVTVNNNKKCDALVLSEKSSSPLKRKTLYKITKMMTGNCQYVC